MQPVGDYTLHELQIISEKHNEGSLLKYFDKTVSYGGRDQLKNMITKPQETLDKTLSVQNLLRTIAKNVDLWQVNISHAYIAATENYYGSNIAHTMSQDIIQHWFQTMIFSFRNPAEFYHIESGLSATFKLFYALKEMALRVKETELTAELGEDFEFIESFLSSFLIKNHLKRANKQLSKRTVFYLDYYLRTQHRKEFRKLLDIYYKLDAYTSIAKASQEYGLSYPEFASQDAYFDVQDTWHPLIPASIKNTFSLDGNPGICILTGANTSGKTTFLKSSGIVIYLAHLGWPVPARYARLSFVDKLFTSIHLSDDISLGYSHFYNEVMRVKAIAQALHDQQRCFVIIDELFRGTNQEDALHCSKTVLNGFSNFNTSLFIVSTHLLELLEGYLGSHAVCFQCFKTKIVGTDFENTFLLEQGIASEKVGKLIMEKAGVPQLLKL